uniref:Ovule protein n=1 Tax=Steinernema glaseri TaxID=37863 RepID=A0A1I7Y9Z1_9BILA
MGLFLLPYCLTNCSVDKSVEQSSDGDGSFFIELVLVALSLSIGVMYLCYIMFLMCGHVKISQGTDSAPLSKTMEATFVMYLCYIMFLMCGHVKISQGTDSAPLSKTMEATFV